MRDLAFEDQMHHASCLVLVIAAIVVWNTVYLAKAVETYQTMQGKRIDPQLLEHLSPWAGIISISWAGTTSRRSGRDRCGHPRRSG